MPASLRVTLRKSPISTTAKARGTVRALGLRRIGHSVEVPDTAVTRGMARAIAFLVEVEEVEGADSTGKATDSTGKATDAQEAEQKAPARRARSTREKGSA